MKEKEQEKRRRGRIEEKSNDHEPNIVVVRDELLLIASGVQMKTTS